MDRRREAESRWGRTPEWREYKSKKLSAEEEKAAAEGLMGIFAVFGRLKALPADAPEVKAEVGRLQSYISEHYYTCTDEVFRGLGLMYSEDPRFKESIDSSGGEGTAEFVSKAISAYCIKKQ